MILKEKLPVTGGRTNTAKKNITADGALKHIFFIICGMILNGTCGGIPTAAALSAAVSPINGACILAGDLIAYLFSYSPGKNFTDIIAIPLILIIKTMFRKMSASASGIAAAVIYTSAGIAANFAYELTPVLMLALVFRGILCGTAAYFASECVCEHRRSGKLSINTGTAVIYVLAAASLSSLSIGNANLGRITGIFTILAAGSLFGTGGSTAAGALAAMGMILGEADGNDLSDLVRSTALISCSGLISGYFADKSRTASAAAFTASMFVFMVFMERIQWASQLMTDSIIASALYCLIPDRFYMKMIARAVNRPSPVSIHDSMCIKMAADTVSAIRSNISEAAEQLRKNALHEKDISREVCAAVCSECRNNSFCCKGELNRSRQIFPSVLRKLCRDGFITEQDLPPAIEGCRSKRELAEEFNTEYRLLTMEQRSYDLTAFIRENTDCQFASSAELLRSFCTDNDKLYDEKLSLRVKDVLEKAGGKNVSSAVHFDRSGNIFISAFFTDRLSGPVSNVTERLSRLTDHELELPCIFTENGTTCIRWHELPVYTVETGKAVCAGSDAISGDSSAVFTDGTGCVYHLISDGMGSGGRAALESGITVSLLTRFIRAGISVSAAIRLTNLILMSKSGDEVFSTVDLLRIDLFTGRADIIKMGAAPTLFSTGGNIRSVEIRSFPAGMLSTAEPDKRTLYLSDGDCAVMFSDGISEKSFPKIRELMLSDGYSAQRCADTVIEHDMENTLPRSDDRTVFVVKMHKS